MNPLAAPIGLLPALMNGNTARAAQFALQRESNSVVLDTTFFKQDSIEMTVSKSFLLQAVVALPDGTSVKKEWCVYWGNDSRSDLPWRVLDVHQSGLSADPAVTNIISQ